MIQRIDQLQELRAQLDHEKARADRLEMELTAIKSIYLNVDLLADALSRFIPDLRKHLHSSSRSDEPTSRTDTIIRFSEWESEVIAKLQPNQEAVFVTSNDLAQIVGSIVGGQVKSTIYIPLMERIGFVRTTKRVDGKPTGIWCRGNSKVATRIVPMPGAASQ